MARRSLLALRALVRDRRGVAAIEFAIIAPVMIVMFFGMVEIGQALIAARRATHACSEVGDLVAQTTSINNSGMSDSFQAAADTLQPLSTSTLRMRVSSVTLRAKNIIGIDWSDGYGGWSGYPAGALVSSSALPKGLLVNVGDSVIVAESSYTFTSPIGYVLPHGLVFTDTAFLRPRQGAVLRTAG